jgi:hypothetical protein
MVMHIYRTVHNFSERGIMKRILLSLLAIGVLIGVSFFFGAPFQAPAAGVITIVLIDGDTEISRDVHAFNEGDTLYDILSRNYTIYCADHNHQKDETCTPTKFLEITGRVLLGINELESNWTDTYIQIQINNVAPEKGMDQLEFTDQDVISLVLKPVDRRN